jgi:DnaJ-class molecular chaperone
MQGQPRHQQHAGNGGQYQPNYRDFAEGQQGSRYNFNGGDFDFSDLEGLFGGFGKRQRAPSADMRYTIEVDFMEAALGAKKRVTMPDGKALDIAIPEGIEEGQQLRLKGKGQPSPGGAGDAYVTVHIGRHPFFTRKGRDIIADIPVSLPESVLGGKIQVPTIHGAVEMNLPKGTASGTTMRLKGKGIKGGDQLVTLKLVMPKEIDADLEAAIREWSQAHGYNPRKHMEQA